MTSKEVKSGQFTDANAVVSEAVRLLREQQEKKALEEMARRALTGLAKRRFDIAVSTEILTEYAEITARVRAELFPAAQLIIFS